MNASTSHHSLTTAACFLLAALLASATFGATGPLPRPAAEASARGVETKTAAPARAGAAGPDAAESERVVASYGRPPLSFEADRDGNYEIYAVDAHGRGQTRLTVNNAFENTPVSQPVR